jgi:hypothetical protein
VGPAYSRLDCPTCVFLDSFLGSDWYFCKWGYPGSIVRVRSVQPHDVEIRVANIPGRGSGWRRAYREAHKMGLI